MCGYAYMNGQCGREQRVYCVSWISAGDTLLKSWSFTEFTLQTGKGLKNVKCLELLRAMQKAGHRARAGPSFQWRAGLSHQTSKSTATWTGLLKFNDKTCRDHSEEHTWELFKVILYNIRVLFLTLEKAELGGVWLGAGAAGWGLRRPLCCPGRTACSGPFQEEKPPSTANSQDDNRNAFFGLYHINSFGNFWISTIPRKSS